MICMPSSTFLLLIVIGTSCSESGNMTVQPKRKPAVPPPFGVLEGGSRNRRAPIFFGNLQKLLYSILMDSPASDEQNWLAQSLVRDLRKGGFCELEDKSGGSRTGYGGPVNSEQHYASARSLS